MIDKNIIFIHTCGVYKDHRYYYKQMPALLNAGFNVSYLVSTSDNISNSQIKTINVPNRTAKRARTKIKSY